MVVGEKRALLAYAVLATAMFLAGAAFAGVFVYQPASISVTYSEPPVVFELGSNANRPDVGAGRFINVTLGLNKTSVSIQINPTYQRTYYKNITLIVNRDTKPYAVFAVVRSRSDNAPANATIFMYIYSGDSLISTIDLRGVPLNASISIGTLGASAHWRIDFLSVAPEGFPLAGRFINVTMEIVYTATLDETPPI